MACTLDTGSSTTSCCDAKWINQLELQVWTCWHCHWIIARAITFTPQVAMWQWLPNVGIVPMGCVMCMYAVVDLAQQLCSNVALTDHVYVGELTAQPWSDNSACNIDQISIKCCFVLIDHLWSCDHSYHQIWNHIRNKMLFSFFPTRSNNRVMEDCLKGCGLKLFLMHLSLLEMAAFAGVV